MTAIMTHFPIMTSIMTPIMTHYVSLFFPLFSIVTATPMAPQATEPMVKFVTSDGLTTLVPISIANDFQLFKSNQHFSGVNELQLSVISKPILQRIIDFKKLKTDQAYFLDFYF